jgi:26S proteasome regulatory subunit N7
MIMSLSLSLQDAEENLGETEVRDALHAKASFLGSIGDGEAAAAAFKDTEDKTASGASKADMVFAQIRCVLFLAEVLCPASM